MSAPGWHDRFDPQRFLSRVDIDALLDRNEVWHEQMAGTGAGPCIVCRGEGARGLLLNDESSVCRKCFEDVSKTRYPEVYEQRHRAYLAERAAWHEARASLSERCPYRMPSRLATGVGIVSLLLVFLNATFLSVCVPAFLTSWVCQSLHERHVRLWAQRHPVPAEPVLRHFHDPLAELTVRDRQILKVFNNSPGYPPFWDYLRSIVLGKDGHRCQVAGCPSRLELHVHHMQPVRNGGEHVPGNLVTLCAFHHALEPDEGHQRVWGQAKTRYFTMVGAHRRRNPSSSGYHDVRAHVRRLGLMDDSEASEIIDFHQLCCPACGSNRVAPKDTRRRDIVRIVCSDCRQQWEGPKRLTEETGPRLAEVLGIGRNRGRWRARWDMLEAREESVFRLLAKAPSGGTKRRGKAAAAKTKRSPTCPECGSRTRLIKPRRGQRWKAFWGCTQYGTTGCRGSRPV